MDMHLATVEATKNDDELIISGFENDFEDGSASGFQMAGPSGDTVKSVSVSVSCSCINVGWTR